MLNLFSANLINMFSQYKIIHSTNSAIKGTINFQSGLREIQIPLLQNAVVCKSPVNLFNETFTRAYIGSYKLSWTERRNTDKIFLRSQNTTKVYWELEKSEKFGKRFSTTTNQHKALHTALTWPSNLENFKPI